MASEQEFNLSQRLELCQQVAKLVRAGRPLERGLAEIANKNRASIAELARTVHEQLSEGRPLSDSLARGASRHAKMLAATIDAGQAAGALGPALDSWTAMQLAQARNSQRLTIAMVYPILLLIVMLASLGFTTWQLIPEYEATYFSLVRHVPDWFAAIRFVHDHLTWALVIGLLSVLLPIGWWWRRRGSLDAAGMPVDAARRASLQAHVAEISRLMIDREVSLETVFDTVWRVAGASGSLPKSDTLFTCLRSRPAENVLGREAALTLAGVAAGLMAPAEASKLLAGIQEQRKRQAEAVSHKQARWLPTLVSLLVGGITVVAYCCLIFIPWIILFRQLALPPVA